MLLTLSILAQGGWIQVSSLSQWASVFFFRNHVSSGGWFNGHLWSLSVEEQFYLCWPLLMVWILSHRSVAGFGLTIGFAVLARLLFLLTGMGNWATYSLAGNLDGLVIGAWAALHLGGRAAWPENLMRHIARWWLLLLPLVAIANFSTSTRFALWASPVQPTMIALMTAAIIRAELVHSTTILHRVLNSKWLSFLGRISYSVYLWQQLFLCPLGAWFTSVTWFAAVPWNIALSLTVGWLSWRLVEVPCLALRSKFSKLS